MTPHSARRPSHPSRSMQRAANAALAAAIAAALAGCATQPPANPPVTASNLPLTAMGNAPVAISQADQGDRARIYRGTGVVVKGQQPGASVSPVPPVTVTGGGVVLNFEGADLREVVRNILGDILNEGYTIDKDVGGQVTIRTTSGVPREALPATLEMLLRMNGAGEVWPLALALTGDS